MLSNYQSLYSDYKKYFIIAAILILLLTVIRMVTYQPIRTKNVNGNEVIEGFKNGPKFKKIEKMTNVNDNNTNPLEYFGFKYASNKKTEKFNNSNAEDERFQNALDEADRIDVNSIGIRGVKETIKRYNNMFSDKLQKAKDENNSLVSTIEQGKVFVNEFKSLFDIGLLI